MSGTPSEVGLELSAAAADILDTGEAGGRAIRGGAMRGLGYVGGLLATLATVPLMIRHLGVIDTGRFLTVTSILFIVAGATEAGISNVAVREYTTIAVGERRRMLANIVGLRIVLTGLGVAFGVAFTLLAGYNSAIVLGTAISGAGLIVTVVQQTYAVPLAATLRWTASSLLDLLNQVLTAILVVVLVVIGARLTPFFVITGLSSLGALIATRVVLRREIGWRPGFDTSAWRRFMRDILPYTFAATVGVLYFRVAMISMSLISTGTQTGYYGVALRVVEVLGGFSGLLVGSVFPILTRAARDDQKRLRYALSRVLDLSIILGAFLAFALAAGAPTVVAVVGGHGFHAAVPVMRIQAIALLPSFVSATGAFALLSLRRHADVLKSSAIALLTAIVGTAILVPVSGAKGAAIATSAAEIVLAISYLGFLVRHRPDLRPRFGTAPAVLAAAGVGCAAALTLPLPNAATAVIAAALFAVVLVVLKAVPNELQQALLAPARGVRVKRG